jgi:hypothetical protein
MRRSDASDQIKNTSVQGTSNHEKTQEKLQTEPMLRRSALQKKKANAIDQVNICIAGPPTNEGNRMRLETSDGMRISRLGHTKHSKKPAAPSLKLIS